jgi:DNA-binding NtrC family response regulator
MTATADDERNGVNGIGGIGGIGGTGGTGESGGPGGTGAHRRRILILDDEPIVCKRLRPAFQKAGYEVEVFTDSATAMDAVRGRDFDIVITDLKMEGTDGMRFLTAVKERRPRTECIVITGFATLETAKESFRKGAYDFVAKPFKLSDIMAVVRRLEQERFGDPDGGQPGQIQSEPGEKDA